MSKCYHCSKKLTIVNNYNCRCTNNFCIKCRLPELHNCTFDHKTFEKNILKCLMVKAVHNKVIQI